MDFVATRSSLLLVVMALFLGSPALTVAQEFGPPSVISPTVPNSDSGQDLQSQVTTDGAGNWVAVWRSSENLGGTVGTDYDIFVSRSTDDGATWSPPAVLNSNASIDSGWDDKPQVTTDGTGNWLAVWHSYDDLSGTIGTDGDILVSRSTDNGATWSTASALNTNAATDSGDDDYPQVTTDDLGNWLATWMSDDSLGGTIGSEDDILLSVSTDNGVTWSAPSALNTNAASDTSSDSFPQVTTDGGGNWVAVWISSNSLGGTIGIDSDVFVSRSTDNGATWTSPAVLNSNAASDGFAGDFFPQVTTDGGGNWVAAWYSNDDMGGTIGFDNDIVVARSTDNGATWTPTTALNANAAADSGDDREPQVTTDGAGNWTATWWSSDDLGGTIGTDQDILVARSTDNGTTWTAPAALNTNAATDSGIDDDPQITTDAAGNWVATWYSYDSLNGTIGTDIDILVALSTDDGATWTSPSALNTNAASDDGHDIQPHVATDGAGNWLAAWASNDSLGGTIGTDWDVLLVRSTDNGVTWTPAAALHPNAATDGGVDFDPQLATDGAGNWVATWNGNDDLGGTVGADDDILVARSTDNGATWTSPAALNTNAATDSGGDSQAHVVTDGAGTWLAAWGSGDDLGGTIGADGDILIASSTDNGATWTAPAILNTNAATDSGPDFSPRLTTDGAGNWLATWWSKDDLGGSIGTDDDILVARSTDNGLTWTAPAVLNTNAATDSGSDRDPQVATDGAGNWVAVWYSNENLGGTLGSDHDILVARSMDNGATWTAPTALHSNAATDIAGDSGVQVATDGSGNWLAAWTSGEDVGGTIGTDNDILVVRSTDGGATWTPPVALNTNAATDSGHDSASWLTTDGAGNWVAAWASYDGLGGLASSGAQDIFVATAGICGDSFVSGAEDCDDGGLVDGDCCSSVCEFEAASSPCPADGIACTDDVCDGAGTCGVPDHGVCDDSYVCTVDVCDPVLDCQNLEEPTDASQCLVALKTKLQIKDSDKVGKDKLQWQWKKGEAFDQLDVGTPEVATSYTLCVYDQSASVSNLALSLEVPASPTLWDDKDPKGAKYKDKAATSDGVFKVQLKTGDATKTKAQLKAKGLNLVLPGPVGATYFEQDPSVVAQLFNSEGACWTTEFEPADNKKHDEEQFKALTK